MVLHSFLLVPYHSWKISHSRHHKSTGHMGKDQVRYIKTERSWLIYNGPGVFTCHTQSGWITST